MKEKYIPGQNALENWLESQRLSREQFGKAEQPLTEAVQMFQPGAGYGAGQYTMIEEEGRKSKAEALANMVSSGMSSGSLATGAGLRVGRDVTKAKLGVEDIRTQFLQQALQALSGLRGQQAGITAQTYNPFETTRMSVEGQQQGAQWDALARVAAANTGKSAANTFGTPEYWGRTPTKSAPSNTLQFSW